MKLNKRILLVMKWIDDPKSVSRDELIENKKSAYATASVASSAAWAAAYADDDAAEYWVNKYFERTVENKQDYIDAIEAEKNPQEIESKEWDGEWMNYLVVGFIAGLASAAMSDHIASVKIERNEVDGYHCQPIQKVETLEEAKARVKQHQNKVRG